MIARPALFSVLVCLARNDEAWCRAMLGAGPTPRTAWRHETPIEAFEALIAAGLLPRHWSDPDRAPRWWCERCRGTGLRDRPGRYPCFRCDSPSRDPATDPPGHTADPPSHAALVAVVSLGVDAIARTEAIVAETWRARVVWRVMTAEEIAERHELTARDGNGHSPVYVFAHEQERALRPHAYGGQPAWPVECPWTAPMQSESTWRALRTLAVRDTDEGPRPTGLHLLTIDDGRVTLAVEALA